MLRYGLIGCGMMGREHIRNIQLLGDTEIKAVFEPDAEMQQQAANLAPQAAFCADLDRLLERDDLDALVISSPNHCHADQLTQIAAKAKLPILVEKPLYTNPDDAARMTAFAADYGAPVWVAMEYRYMPPIAEFIEQVETATGGVKMLSITEHRFPFLQKVNNWNRFNRNSGGTFVEKCCHFFDLMRHILNAEPIRVTASAGQAHNHLDETYDGEQPDIWDHGYVLVDFDSGQRAMLELCMFAEGARYQEQVVALGPVGKIACHVPGPGRFWSGPGAAPRPQLVISPRDGSETQHFCDVPDALLDAGDHNGSTFYQHQRFAEVVKGRGKVEVTLQDGMMAVKLGQAAQIAAREHRVVDFAEL